jgi:hypothetical protein
MDLDALLRAAKLTLVSQEPLQQFRPVGVPSAFGLAVEETGLYIRRFGVKAAKALRALAAIHA